MSGMAFDRIQQQVMWNRLLAVVEEQARTMIRASFSPAVREGGDLSAGVFDQQGRMLAQGVTGTPGHVNTMALAVTHFLEAYPLEEMQPGDVYITNDPWLASGHLYDVTIVSPAFHRGQAIGLFAATVHLVDVGGRGMGVEARQVYEEGVLIPIMPLARQGEINHDLLGLLLANSREPFQVRGDLLAIMAAGDEGARRLSAMMAEFDLDDLEGLAEMIIQQSRDATLAALGKLARGTFQSEMTIDGYEKPVRICLSMTVADDGITVDYTGSSTASLYGINVVENYTAAYTVYGLMCAAAPNIPNNHGSIGCFDVTAPAGSILNAPRPAAVAARHIVGHALPDAVFGCLSLALPGSVPAESGMMWNPYLRGNRTRDDGNRPWELFLFNAGGMGARPDQDGLSATAFPSGIKNIPVEAAEAVAPIIFHRKEFRPDSGGAGQYRGGLGQVIELGSSCEDELGFQAMFDRSVYPAQGRSGGRPGAHGHLRLKSGDARQPKGLQFIPHGDVLLLNLPGGGGCGDPFSRPLETVADDIENGLVSPGSADRDYGVRIGANGPEPTESRKAKSF